MVESPLIATPTLEATPIESQVPWLLTAKVTPPEPGRAYFDRPELFRQLDQEAGRRVVVLRAPGGFGKTTTLAEIVRRAKQQGTRVAWLTVDEDDTPGVFGAHLAYAFERAGVDLGVGNNEEAWTATPLTHQIGMLVRALEMHEGPCVLVLDELERLPVRSVGLLQRLLSSGPDVLRFVLALRANPGLDLTSLLLEGSAVVLTAEQFRFSRSEIAGFFGDSLTRRELTEIADRTAGWPVAVRIARGLRHAGATANVKRGEDLTRDFLDARLLRDLTDRDRNLLLDLAVFDWIDTDLADEVLESADTRLRVETLPMLDGLLTPVDGTGTMFRLHPLVKQHCVRQLAARDPVRKRHLHRRIAEALEHRDHLIPAWRHAAETGDHRFLGEMIERVGVFRLWLRGGPLTLAAVDGFVNPTMLKMFPRIALIRCASRCLEGEFEEARELWRVTTQRADTLARDGAVGDPEALLVDRLFTEVTLVGSHSRPASDDLQDEVATNLPVAAAAEHKPLVLCGLHLSQYIASYQSARFETFQRHGSELRSHVKRDDFRYGEAFVTLYLGMAAMVQGRVDEAAGHYAVAQRIIKASFAADAALATALDALTIEIDIERDRQRAIDLRMVRGMLEPLGAWVEAYEAAIAVTAELLYTVHGAEVAVQLLEEECARDRAKRLSNVSHYVSALLSLYQVEAGRPDEGEQVWRDARLPTDVPDLVDLDRRSWREMELLGCTRIRLLVELGDRDAARELANHVRRRASERGLTRTLMRALALLMAVDTRADWAVERLVEILRLVCVTDYVRPLARYRSASCAVLARLLDDDPDPQIRAAAESTLARLDNPRPSNVPVLSPRERAVLAELRNGLRNREIADRLGVSEDGVRYHLKNIYRKIGAMPWTAPRRWVSSEVSERPGILPRARQGRLPPRARSGPAAGPVRCQGRAYPCGLPPPPPRAGVRALLVRHRTTASRAARLPSIGRRLWLCSRPR